jgi:hypothetical protein
LEDADDAFYVRGDLNARRHATVTERLTLKIAQVEDVIAAAEPSIDTTPLRDRSYVTRRWAEHNPRRPPRPAAYGVERDPPH